MAVETIEDVTKSRDEAWARVKELNGFRRNWKEKYWGAIRKLDAAQAHAWELEENIVKALNTRVAELEWEAR